MKISLTNNTYDAEDTRTYCRQNGSLAGVNDGQRRIEHRRVVQIHRKNYADDLLILNFSTTLRHF